jgi:hypothetical protein
MSYLIWDLGYSLWDGNGTLWDSVDPASVYLPTGNYVTRSTYTDWRPNSYNTDGDINRLAIGCLNLLAGRAVVDFPSSTRSHPSFFVTVSLSSDVGLKDGDQKYFPFQVPWYIWQRVVVPVLHPETLETDFGVAFKDKLVESLRVWKNIDAANLEDYVSLTDHVSMVIATLMELYGYIPSGTVATYPTVLAASGSAPGEPIVRGPVVGDPNYPRSDETLTWAEGHPRLQYPVV